ncbi:hypothetical protein [Pelagibaculum spongiae]|uniref:Outer membrane lipoprotein BamD-like domain-containing protein n=1 Tax=Pelagibaculum spongiae TaxID=2080658 RepID=A0A2V1H1I1_9GAMM|nr:hypothetical protein [Pelagibaculum spongiae]PVZ69530.1 hypothetical protein DC094_09390 [Pelagibaculum spongiae]
MKKYLLVIALLLAACGDEARDSLDAAKQASTLEALDYYLNRYPESPYLDEALQAREDVLVKAALLSAGYAEIVSFIEQYPENNSQQILQRTLDKRLFQSATEENDLQAMTLYLKFFPESRRISIVDKLRDSLLYDQAQAANSLQSYDQYLTDYPNGRYAGDAKNRRENRLFESASQSNNKRLLQQYANQYPDGRFANNVKNMLRKLGRSRLKARTNNQYKRWQPREGILFNQWMLEVTALEKMNNQLLVYISGDRSKTKADCRVNWRWKDQQGRTSKPVEQLVALGKSNQWRISLQELHPDSSAIQIEVASKSLHCGEIGQWKSAAAFNLKSKPTRSGDITQWLESQSVLGTGYPKLSLKDIRISGQQLALMALKSPNSACQYQLRWKDDRGRASPFINVSKNNQRLKAPLPGSNSLTLSFEIKTGSSSCGPEASIMTPALALADLPSITPLEQLTAKPLIDKPQLFAQVEEVVLSGQRSYLKTRIINKSGARCELDWRINNDVQSLPLSAQNKPQVIWLDGDLGSDADNMVVTVSSQNCDGQHLGTTPELPLNQLASTISASKWLKDQPIVAQDHSANWLFRINQLRIAGNKLRLLGYLKGLDNTLASACDFQWQWQDQVGKKSAVKSKAYQMDTEGRTLMLPLDMPASNQRIKLAVRSTSNACQPTNHWFYSPYLEVSGL